MVLYKLSLQKSTRLFAFSAVDKAKSYLTRVVSPLDKANAITLHNFANRSHLNLWTMITDTIFGGSTNCRLGYTDNRSFLFSGTVDGELRSTSNAPFSTPNAKVISGFARMWFVYVGLHKDLSDYQGLRIKYRVNDEAPLGHYQCQLQHHDFLDDTFFYCPFNLNSNLTTEKDGDGIEWSVVELPFERFSLNRMGREMGISNDFIDTLKEKDFIKYNKDDEVPTHDIISIGVGITSSVKTNFAIEMKSIEAY